MPAATVTLSLCIFIIEPPGSKPRLYIACKEAGRVRVEPERVEVQRINFEGLAKNISNLLELGAPRVIIEGRLWLLGSSHLGDRIRDVFFARGATWRDGRSIVDHARVTTSPCPVILVPHRLPDDPIWRSNDRILMSMSEFDWFGNDCHAIHNSIAAIVAEHDRQLPATETAVFRREGGTWRLSFDGTTVHLPNALGVGYICELLRCPGVAIEAARLAGVSVELSNLAALPGIALATPATIKAVRAKFDEKKKELAGFTGRNWTRKGALEEEISKLKAYLSQVETHRGGARKVAGTAQRSRTSVTNAMNRSINRISTLHPKLGRHLKESIKTGTSPIYSPVALQDWHF